MAVLATLAVGCASDPLTFAEGRFQHRRRPLYTIAAPDGGDLAWKRIELRGAQLAFRSRASQTMTLRAECDRPQASPQIMARHLRIGIRESEMHHSGPISHAGLDGWTQTFETIADGAAVLVKTVTLLGRDCTFDWVLATPSPLEPIERAFDAWWQSFRLDSGVASTGKERS